MAAGMVIVGAGQAGLQIAESLRTEGYDGPITLLGEEPEAPYHRPPLSKAMLSGTADESQLTIRGPDVLDRKGIRLATGVPVVGIDRAARRLRLADGREQAYDGLALATGARARPLPVPGGELAGVFALRSLADARRIDAALTGARHAVVVGGGFIGLEVAAAARKRGVAVTVLEAADRLMARVAVPVLSGFFTRLHETHGVAVERGASVVALDGREGRVTGVRLADGREFPADLVVVGVGVVPNDGLAADCGLACDGGILVDACSRSSDPAIVAAGDCTVRRDETGGGLLRLESVQNAVEQAKSAAAALMGRERPFVAAPWFWSDQYDVKLQMAGLPAGHDQTVTRGSPDEGRFSLFHFRNGALVAVDSVNQPQDHMAARKLLDRRVLITPEQAADIRCPLASLAR